MDLSLSELRELVMDREPRGAAVYGVTKSWATELNWIETHSHNLLFLDNWISQKFSEGEAVLKQNTLLLYNP